MTSNTFKEAVLDYCVLIGSDSMLVQGAGGNVSWKDGDTLWVKASGTWLADAKEKDIFVPVDLDNLKIAIKDGNFAITPKVKSESPLRPSIETLLHALMPHRVVVHVHAIEALAHLVRYEPEHEISQKLKTVFNWKMVSYQKPGEALAKAVANALTETPDVNILLLQNHGIVIGGDNVEAVNNDLNKLLSLLTTSPNIIGDDFSIPDSIIIGKQTYLPVNIPCCHKLVIDASLFSKVKTNWALLPDHVVFLGHRPACYDSVESLVTENDFPELIFLKGLGVFTSTAFNVAKQAQLKCYYDVIIRQPQHAHLNALNEQQIAELLNWDAEHYRQNLAKS